LGSLPKVEETEENNSESRAEMRAKLDDLFGRQTVPVWSLQAKAHPPAPYVEDADEEEDEIVSRPDSAADGSYDDNMGGTDHVARKTSEKAAAEETTIEGAAAEKLATEKAAAEEPREIDNTVEKTQLGAADGTHQNDGTVSPGTSANKPAEGTKGSFVTKKTIVTKKTTLTEKSGVTKKTAVRTKKVVTWRRS
jgi:hypothetical protein